MLLALPMYDLPEVAWATDALAAGLLAACRAEGFADLPATHDRTLAYTDQWLEPDLLLGQACGYPMVTMLAGKVRYVATPCYAAPGCEGPLYCSVLVVRRDDPAEMLAELAGRRAAYNRAYSQSGYNVLRHAVAPLAREGRFFGPLMETGGHVASVAAVVEGHADVAAIDAVTWALLARHRAALIEPLRIIGRTASAPGLPFITRAGASDDEIERLRQALGAVLRDPALAEVRATLLLSGLELLPEAAYDSLLGMERDAAGRGYPQLA